jgi:hypothetical protein
MPTGEMEARLLFEGRGSRAEAHARVDRRVREAELKALRARPAA